MLKTVTDLGYDMRSTLAKYLRQYQEEEPFYGQEFGIPRQPHTSSKSIRFPKDLVGTVIGRGESAFVVEPVRFALDSRSRGAVSSKAL